VHGRQNPWMLRRKLRFRQLEHFCQERERTVAVPEAGEVLCQGCHVGEGIDIVRAELGCPQPDYFVEEWDRLVPFTRNMVGPGQNRLGVDRNEVVRRKVLYKQIGCSFEIIDCLGILTNSQIGSSNRLASGSLDQRLVLELLAHLLRRTVKRLEDGQTRIW